MDPSIVFTDVIEEDKLALPCPCPHVRVGYQRRQDVNDDTHEQESTLQPQDDKSIFHPISRRIQIMQGPLLFLLHPHHLILPITSRAHAILPYFFFVSRR